MGDQVWRRPVMISGGVFAVAFAVGLSLVGDQAGAFADSESAYVAIFSDSSHRIRDVIGSLLLIVAAVTLGVFTYLLTPVGVVIRPSLVVARVAGMLAAASILVAGAAFLTVPASLTLGDFFGDPGIVTAQPVLSSFGYIMLVVGSAIPAAALMVASTRFVVYPTWLGWSTVVAAVLLVATAPSVITMVLLPIWVAAASLVAGRSAPFIQSER